MPASPVTIRSVTTMGRTASSPSRTSPSSPRVDSREVGAFRIVVLASGGGTNLQAILDQLHGEEEGIEVVGVGSDKPDAMSLERAQKASVETAVFPASEY